MSDSVRPMALLRVGGWIFLFFLLLIPMASSQFYNVLYVKKGEAAGDQFGRSVAALGDVNGDAKTDFLIGCPKTDISGVLDVGSIYIYSGTSGEVIRKMNGPLSKDKNFGWAVAGTESGPDIDGDGVADFIVGMPRIPIHFPVSPGSGIFVYSGATGNLIYSQFEPWNSTGLDLFGYSVAIMGDIEGDSKSEVLVGAPHAFDPNHFSMIGGAYLFLAQDLGNSFAYYPGQAEVDSFGFSVAQVGDLNNDGVPDALIGAPKTDPFGRSSAGSAYVKSGSQNSTIFQMDGAAPNYNLGWAVAGLGDIVENDNKNEFIIGAPGASSAGKAFVYSGATGQTVHTLSGESAGAKFGWSVANAGDVNGDGKSDFIVGALASDSGIGDPVGAAYIYSGADASLLFKRYGKQNLEGFGSSVAGVEDVNGDGKADIIIGVPFRDDAGIDRGSVLVYVNCPKRKGDMNGDGNFTPADIALLQNCVFVGSGDCNRCFADMNCDGLLDNLDVIILQNLVYHGTPPPC